MLLVGEPMLAFSQSLSLTQGLCDPERTHSEHQPETPISTFQNPLAVFTYRFILIISSQQQQKGRKKIKQDQKIHIQCKTAQPVSPKQQISREHSPKHVSGRLMLDANLPQAMFFKKCQQPNSKSRPGLYLLFSHITHSVFVHRVGNTILLFYKEKQKRFTISHQLLTPSMILFVLKSFIFKHCRRLDMRFHRTKIQKIIYLLQCDPWQTTHK